MIWFLLAALGVALTGAISVGRRDATVNVAYAVAGGIIAATFLNLMCSIFMGQRDDTYQVQGKISRRIVNEQATLVFMTNGNRQWAIPRKDVDVAVGSYGPTLRVTKAQDVDLFYSVFPSGDPDPQYLLKVPLVGP